MKDAKRVPPALGPRGEGWVAGQAILFPFFVLAAAFGTRWPHGVRGWFFPLGICLAVCGGILAGGGIRGLGASLTAFPKPHDTAELRTASVYRWARHPVYGGLMLVIAGGSLATSPLGIAPAAALVCLFMAKSRLEERWLSERYPGYADYASRVGRKFLPWVW